MAGFAPQTEPLKINSLRNWAALRLKKCERKKHFCCQFNGATTPGMQHTGWEHTGRGSRTRRSQHGGKMDRHGVTWSMQCLTKKLGYHTVPWLNSSAMIWFSCIHVFSLLTSESKSNIKNIVAEMGSSTSATCYMMMASVSSCGVMVTWKHHQFSFLLFLSPAQFLFLMVPRLASTLLEWFGNGICKCAVLMFHTNWCHKWLSWKKKGRLRRRRTRGQPAW